MKVQVTNGKLTLTCQERTEKGSFITISFYKNMDTKFVMPLNLPLWCFFSIVFLSTELQALKILHSKKSKSSHLEKHNEINQEVQAICDALGLPNSSSSDIPPLLNNVEQKVQVFSLLLTFMPVSIHLSQGPNRMIHFILLSVLLFQLWGEIFEWLPEGEVCSEPCFAMQT